MIMVSHAPSPSPRRLLRRAGDCGKTQVTVKETNLEKSVFRVNGRSFSADAQPKKTDW